MFLVFISAFFFLRETLEFCQSFGSNYHQHKRFKKKKKVQNFLRNEKVYIFKKPKGKKEGRGEGGEQQERKKKKFTQMAELDIQIT